MLRFRTYNTVNAIYTHNRLWRWRRRRRELAIDFLDFFFLQYYYETYVRLTKEDITRKTLVFHSFWRKRARRSNDSNANKNNNNIIYNKHGGDDVTACPICNTFGFGDFVIFLLLAFVLSRPRVLTICVYYHFFFSLAETSFLHSVGM